MGGDSAPRIPWPIVAEVRRLSRTDLSAAQINREIGRFAAVRGLHRPSYQTVRRFVRRQREIDALPSAIDPLVDGWLRARSPRNAVDEAFRRAERRALARARLEAERDWRPTGVDPPHPGLGSGPHPRPAK